MRMWLVNPKGMCRQHLLGEHVELHMFIGTIKKGINLDGYFANDLIEPLSIVSRHEALVEEMQVRGYNHKSPVKSFAFPDMSATRFTHRIDREKSLAELVRRCPECSKGFAALEKQSD